MARKACGRQAARRSDTGRRFAILSYASWLFVCLGSARNEISELQMLLLPVKVRSCPEMRCARDRRNGRPFASRLRTPTPLSPTATSLTPTATSTHTPTCSGNRRCLWPRRTASTARPPWRHRVRSRPSEGRPCRRRPARCSSSASRPSRGKRCALKSRQARSLGKTTRCRGPVSP